MFKNLTDIFFDFDGVILDSVSCKTDAFEAMYSKYGLHISNKVKKYHLLNGGISRFDKFRYWHKKHLNIDLNDAELEKLNQTFSKLVLNKVIKSPKIKGSFDFIKNYHKKYNFWIITGTPDDEIKIITKTIGIYKYFKGVYGSPEKKPHWTEHIIQKNSLDRNCVLFIGDALTDYHASLHSKLHFALVNSRDNLNIFKDIDVFKFTDFKNLEANIL